MAPLSAVCVHCLECVTTNSEVMQNNILTNKLENIILKSPLLELEDTLQLIQSRSHHLCVFSQGNDGKFWTKEMANWLSEGDGHSQDVLIRAPRLQGHGQSGAWARSLNLGWEY